MKIPDTRLLADTAGATVGTLGGIFLSVYFLWLGIIGGSLAVNGMKLGNNGYAVDIAATLLTIGVCANLGRNGAVGLHDVIKNVYEGFKYLLGCCGGRAATVLPTEMV